LPPPYDDISSGYSLQLENSNIPNYNSIFI